MTGDDDSKAAASTGPTLEQDEAALAGYAEHLADALAGVVEPWFDRLVERHRPGLAAEPAVRSRLDQAARHTAERVREVLTSDIDRQRSGPLEVMRRAAHGEPTAVLRQAGVEPVDRDEFAQRNFPDDIYDLSPASFADIDPSLHEPGLVWGAAKAHVHLRRRREAETAARADTTPQAVGAERVVVLSVDLMDRSKIAGALPGATLVRSLSAVGDGADADLVIVDLQRVDDMERLREINSRVIAFGSHVDDATLAAATAAGAEALPRSVFFRRLSTGEL